MILSGKFYFFILFLFFSQKGFSIDMESQTGINSFCRVQFMQEELGTDLAEVTVIDDLSPESRIHLILPIERLNLTHSVEVAVKERVNQIGGLTAMTKEEAQTVFGYNETVEINDALLSEGLSFGMLSAWPLHPDQVRKIQLEARELVIGRLSSDQRANLFHLIMELNLSEANKNILRASGMRYVGRLVTKTERDILRISNDRSFLNEVNTALSELYLTLDMKFDWPNRPGQVQKLKDRFLN